MMLRAFHKKIKNYRVALVVRAEAICDVVGCHDEMHTQNTSF